VGGGLLEYAVRISFPYEKNQKIRNTKIPIFEV
jgi:hypothetical protein